MFTLLRRCKGCGLRRCAIVRQYVSLDKYRKENGTITVMYLDYNKIGDEGAVALAESLKATFVTYVLQVRASLFLRVAVLMASLRARLQETFCQLSRISFGMLFDGTFFCVDACVRVRRFVRKNPPTFCQ